MKRFSVLVPLLGVTLPLGCYDGWAHRLLDESTKSGTGTLMDTAGSSSSGPDATTSGTGTTSTGTTSTGTTSTETTTSTGETGSGTANTETTTSSTQSDTNDGDGDGDGDTCDYDTDCGSIPAGMRCVPAGTFEMGSDDFETKERPVREICLPTYYVDRHEVTVEEYSECVSDGDCATPGTTTFCNWGVEGNEDHPINCVDWHGAMDYCTWAGKRLLTEAEWEKAARGTDGRLYPWGSDTPTCEFAVMGYEEENGCGTEMTWPVGSKPKGDSPYGVSDMAGNIYEWCSDWHGPYDPSDLDDPQGPKSGAYRVLRGGSWRLIWAGRLRTSDRAASPPTRVDLNFGFRCAKDG